jgi:lipopolysaccharide transport system permease protein
MAEGSFIISSGQSASHYLRELWAHRYLVYVLAWRNVKVLYKQTLIGVLWVLLRPLLMLLILTFVFGQVGGLAAESAIPYVLVVLAGLLPWQTFAHALQGATGSLVENEALLTRVWFPRMAIPLSAVLSSLVDTALTFLLLLVWMLAFSYWPGWGILGLVVLFPGLLLLATGLGLWLGGLNVRYRDFRYALPFLLQIGLYISPVGFRTADVPADWQFVFQLNPLAGYMEAFRWCLLGSPDPFFTPALGYSLAVSVGALLLGWFSFRRMEDTFADVI